MKTVLLLAGLVALVMGSALPKDHEIKLKEVDLKFVEYQKKILELFEHSEQLDYYSDYYKVGKDYDIEANLQNYSNKQAVEEFLLLYRTGTLPKYYKFSIFYERMREEAIALFHVMYYAKDFETFYKTASWAKIYMNEEQFFYAYYIAIVQREDFAGIVLPEPYEVYPQFYFNNDIMQKLYRVKMQNNIVFDEKFAAHYGIVKENNNYVFYANYSNSLTYPNKEQKLSYFTEDIGLNSYYFYFHSQIPFWWKSGKIEVLKDRLGEIFFFFYQRLLARYYLERLPHGLGEIPEFSWYSNFKPGYYPQLHAHNINYVPRSNDYNLHNENNYKYISFLDTYEKTFIQLLQKGDYDNIKSFEKQLKYFGNSWYMNSDFSGEKRPNKDLFQYSYEIIARHVLSAKPKPIDKYLFMPSALDFYQTSLRDPAFYQLYQRILNYLKDYKQHIQPFSHIDRVYVGAEVNDVDVTELVTYFDYFDFNATNSVYYNKEELKSYPVNYIVRQPRLNHKPFSVKISVKSDVASEAVIKIIIGPKYDANGNAVNFEDDWMKLYELDSFVKELVPGDNTIERKSSEFVYFKDDPFPISAIYKWLDQGKVPYDMSMLPHFMPRRLMLPKGSSGGFPFQILVYVYPINAVSKKETFLDTYVSDNYFKQRHYFFKDVKIYHKDA